MAKRFEKLSDWCGVVYDENGDIIETVSLPTTFLYLKEVVMEFGERAKNGKLDFNEFIAELYERITQAEKECEEIIDRIEAKYNEEK